MQENAKLIQYTGDECPKCGRVRVELWLVDNKYKRICEKCNWNLDTNEYEVDDL